MNNNNSSSFLGFLNFSIARLKEPSTWAALAAMFVALHITVEPGLWQSLANLGIAASVVLGYFMPEQKKQTDVISK